MTPNGINLPTNSFNVSIQLLLAFKIQHLAELANSLRLPTSSFILASKHQPKLSSIQHQRKRFAALRLCVCVCVCYNNNAPTFIVSKKKKKHRNTFCSLFTANNIITETNTSLPFQVAICLRKTDSCLTFLYSSSVMVPSLSVSCMLNKTVGRKKTKHN